MASRKNLRSAPSSQIPYHPECTFAPLISARSLALTASRSRTLDDMCHGDQQRLAQTMQQLAKEQEQSDLSAPFRPTLNDLHGVTSFLQINDDPSSYALRIWSRNHEKQRRLDRIKEETIAKEMTECSFAPNYRRPAPNRYEAPHPLRQEPGDIGPGWKK